MATKKTSTTSNKGQSRKPAAKGNGAKTKAAVKTSGNGRLAAKPTESPRGAARAPKAARAAKPAKRARTATRPPAPKAAPPAKSKPGKRPAAIVHWEIQSKQPEALHQFYGDVFGWAIDANNEFNYGLVSSKGTNGGIDGGIGPSSGNDARVLVYASVPSIPTTLKRIEELGGRTIMPRTDMGPVVMAIYLDPEGNTMGLIEDR